MTKTKSHKIGLFGLIAMVVCAMIGGGIFDIPQNMAASSPLGAVLNRYWHVWTCFYFQNLS